MVEVQEWSEIRRLRFVEGLSKREIARRTGRNRRTVDRALASDQLPKYERPRAGSKLDPFKDEIKRLLTDDSRIPSQRIREKIEELGYAGGRSICDDYIRSLRPLYAPERTFQKTDYRPGEILQFDLWRPKREIPVGHGQTRKGYVVVCALGYSRAGAGSLIFRKKAPDILAGLWRGISRLGGVPEQLVIDREAALHAGSGRPTDDFAAFAGALAAKPVILAPRDCQAKGVVERLQGYMATNFEPGRSFSGHRDFQMQMDQWFAMRANQRVHRELRERPSARLAHEAGKLRPLPDSPSTDHRFTIRVPTQPYLRFDTNDYSLDPAFAGRRVEVRAGQSQVQAFALTSGELVAEHEREFAQHMTITDPAHQSALAKLREQRMQQALSGRAKDVEVEARDLSRYDELVA